MKRLGSLGLLVIALLLAGCGRDAEPTPTPLPEQAFASLISVTGEVVPADWSRVSTQAGGTVVELLVEPGNAVSGSDLLVRLDSAEAELAVRRAEVAVEAAELQLEALESGPRPEAIAVAEARVEAAKPAVDQAEAQLTQLEAGSLDAEIAAADAQVTRAEIDKLVAYEMHEDTMTCVQVEVPGEGEQEVCPLLGPPEEKARFRLQAAREKLDAARSRYAALIGERDARFQAAELAVERARAQQDAAEAQLEQAKAGASREEIVAAEARFESAKVALEKAETALKRTDVRAPLSGTVGGVHVRENEMVAPGQPLVTVGDLSTLRVETTDLDEIDVARVELGQVVDVTFDAMADEVYVGRVTRISPMAEPEGGGVNYTVVIELETVDPRIRWGMTAFVDIEVAE